MKDRIGFDDSQNKAMLPNQQKSLDDFEKCFEEIDKHDSPIITIALASNNPINMNEQWAEIIQKGNCRADPNLAKIIENAYRFHLHQSGQNVESDISIPILSEEQSAHIYGQTNLKNYSRIIGASPKFPHTIFIEKNKEY